MKYLDLKKEHQKDIDAFPFAFAFNDEQFEEGMKKLGLDPSKDRDKIVAIGAGGFIHVNMVGAYIEMMRRHEREMHKAMEDDDFLFDMFYYELGNHEYIITYDIEDTLDACGLSQEYVDNHPRYAKVLSDAITKYVHSYYENN